MRCQSCEMLSINGLPCHETGCPDKWTTETLECRWCGQDFKPEDRSQKDCSPCCFAAYAGAECECAFCSESRQLLEA